MEKSGNFVSPENKMGTMRWVQRISVHYFTSHNKQHQSSATQSFVFDAYRRNISLQECIPAGWVPPTRYPIRVVSLTELPWTETLPGQSPPPHIDPLLDRDPPGQRPPGQRPPDKRPPDRDPLLDRDSPPGQRLPSLTETPLLDRDSPVQRSSTPWTEWHTGVKPLPCPKRRLRTVTKRLINVSGGVEAVDAGDARDNAERRPHQAVQPQAEAAGDGVLPHLTAVQQRHHHAGSHILQHQHVPQQRRRACHARRQYSRTQSCYTSDQRYHITWSLRVPLYYSARESDFFFDLLPLKHWF